MKLITAVPVWLQPLLAETPSMRAAMKAGRHTSIAGVVIKGCNECPPCLTRLELAGVIDDAGTDLEPWEIEDRPCENPRGSAALGILSNHETAWARFLTAWFGSGRRVIRFVYNGREVERSTY